MANGKNQKAKVRKEECRTMNDECRMTIGKSLSWACRRGKLQKAKVKKDKTQKMQELENTERPMEQVSKTELRKFGLTVGGAFILLGLISWWRGHEWAPRVLWTLGALLAVPGALAPALHLDVDVAVDGGFLGSR